MLRSFSNRVATTCFVLFLAACDHAPTEPLVTEGPQLALALSVASPELTTSRALAAVDVAHVSVRAGGVVHADTMVTLSSEETRVRLPLPSLAGDTSTMVTVDVELASDGFPIFSGSEEVPLRSGTTTVSIEVDAVLDQVEPALAVSAGEHTTCSLNLHGQAFCWGVDPSRANSTTEAERSLAPRKVETPERFVAITAGLGHACALTIEGAAWCWGNNDGGQLGDGSLTASGSPVQVEGGLLFATLDAGYAHTCASTLSGEAYCWGAVVLSNALGSEPEEFCVEFDEPCSTRPRRVDVPVGLASASAGLAHSCGVATNGGYCWGWNAYRQIRPEATIDFPAPVSVVLPGVPSQMYAGSLYSCALIGTEAWCWGGVASSQTFDHGQFGDGRSDGQMEPGRVLGNIPFTNLVLAEGNSVLSLFTCGLSTSGQAWCWGSNQAGQLGAPGGESCLFAPADLTFDCRRVPAEVGTSARFSALASGNAHVCGLTTERRILCWGSNEYGQLGDGSTTDRQTPGSIEPAATPTPAGAVSRAATQGVHGLQRLDLLTDPGAILARQAKVPTPP